MLSVTLDSSGSPKKRTFSRGISEDESLRSIITETESSSRRMTRSDSRAGTLKRRSDSQFEQDLVMGLPEMLELQASYDEVVQELRGVEVEREVLFFQVDVLQDTLEGVEELLAEAQREAGQANSELEREREAKRKLESMVCSLMQELERLKEEANNKPSATHGNEAEPTRQIKNEQIEAALRHDVSSSAPEPLSSKSSAKVPDEVAEDEGSLMMKLRKMVSKPLGHLPSLALDKPVSEDGVLQRPYESDGRDPSPDRNDSDSISAYEDASAETPEQDKIFPGKEDTSELPYDSENNEKSQSINCQDNESKTEDPKNPDACIVS